MKNLLLFLPILITGCVPVNSEIPLKTEVLERVSQTMVAPPYLPEHMQRDIGNPKIIEVRLIAEEKEIQISEDVYIHAMTFNGTVPGPIIVAHQNDYIELTLVNPATNTYIHNIDFHAATGGLGGGSITKIKPGEEVKIKFKATKTGVFVYHCAPGGAMIPHHVVSGMNGVIMILPRDGLRDNHGESVHYDRAYYIGEQDYYISKNEYGEYKRYDSANEAMGDMLTKMQTLNPSHIVFNGRQGALTGNNALRASVGEKVLFIHAQANRDSRPHLIGGHGELVWEGGSFSDAPVTNRETWFIPGGSAVAALYQFKQPETYVYLNHSLIEAVLFGAMAHVKVDGEWNNDLLQQLVPPHPSE